jgi:hypothetical protein
MCKARVKKKKERKQKSTQRASMKIKIHPRGCQEPG